jgi:hypothetical protein
MKPFAKAKPTTPEPIMPIFMGASSELGPDIIVNNDPSEPRLERISLRAYK